MRNRDMQRMWHQMMQMKANNEDISLEEGRRLYKEYMKSWYSTPCIRLNKKSLLQLPPVAGAHDLEPYITTGKNMSANRTYKVRKTIPVRMEPQEKPIVAKRKRGRPPGSFKTQPQVKPDKSQAQKKNTQSLGRPQQKSKATANLSPAPKKRKPKKDTTQTCIKEAHMLPTPLNLKMGPISSTDRTPKRPSMSAVDMRAHVAKVSTTASNKSSDEDCIMEQSNSVDFQQMWNGIGGTGIGVSSNIVETIPAKIEVEEIDRCLQNFNGKTDSEIDHEIANTSEFFEKLPNLDKTPLEIEASQQDALIYDDDDDDDVLSVAASWDGLDDLNKSIPSAKSKQQSAVPKQQPHKLPQEQQQPSKALNQQQPQQSKMPNQQQQQSKVPNQQQEQYNVPKQQQKQINVPKQQDQKTSRDLQQQQLPYGVPQAEQQRFNISKQQHQTANAQQGCSISAIAMQQGEPGPNAGSQQNHQSSRNPFKNNPQSATTNIVSSVKLDQQQPPVMRALYEQKALASRQRTPMHRLESVPIFAPPYRLHQHLPQSTHSSVPAAPVLPSLSSTDVIPKPKMMTPILKHWTDELFGVKCYMYLDNNCSNSNCTHSFNNVSEVQVQLIKLENASLEAAYKRVKHSMVLFKEFFALFINVFSNRQMISHLKHMIYDCRFYKQLCAPFLSPIYGALQLNGMVRNELTSMFMGLLWFPSTAIRYKALTNALLEMLAKSNWHQYIDQLMELFISHKFPIPSQFLKDIALDAIRSNNQMQLEAACRLAVRLPLPINDTGTLGVVLEMLAERRNYLPLMGTLPPQQQQLPQPQPLLQSQIHLPSRQHMQNQLHLEAQLTPDTGPLRGFHPAQQYFMAPQPMGRMPGNVSNRPPPFDDGYMTDY